MKRQVQTSHDKYTVRVCLSEEARESTIDYLRNKGIEIYPYDSPGMTDPEYSDLWEIEIPVKKIGRGKNVKYVRDITRMDSIIADLRQNPGAVKSDYGDIEYGEALAEILEAGIEVAVNRAYSWILVDFW